MARWEEDYDGERPELVKDALSLIWASRRGLSEAELLDLLGTRRQPLPHAVLAPFFLGAADRLQSILHSIDGHHGPILLTHLHHWAAQCEQAVAEEQSSGIDKQRESGFTCKRPLVARRSEFVSMEGFSGGHRCTSI